MLILNETIPALINGEDSTLKYKGQDIIGDSIFFDLEHYLYKEPIAIGVFGAAVYEKDEKAIKTTQYMIENKKDARVILNMRSTMILTKSLNLWISRKSTKQNSGKISDLKIWRSSITLKETAN